MPIVFDYFSINRNLENINLKYHEHIRNHRHHLDPAFRSSYAFWLDWQILAQLTLDHIGILSWCDPRFLRIGEQASDQLVIAFGKAERQNSSPNLSSQ